MKNILYILITLSILSTGCSKEDDVQITQEVTNNLDENLYGTWKLSDDGSNIYDYYRSFSSNGRSGYWRERDGNPNDSYSVSDWYVQDNYIFFNSNSILSYSVSGITLTLNSGLWIKQ
tara:strand:+ start:110 stop:463 length:354 start_codon:yes stop_codon:yes gene_type:complete